MKAGDRALHPSLEKLTPKTSNGWKAESEDGDHGAKRKKRVGFCRRGRQPSATTRTRDDKRDDIEPGDTDMKCKRINARVRRAFTENLRQRARDGRRGVRLGDGVTQPLLRGILRVWKTLAGTSSTSGSARRHDFTGASRVASPSTGQCPSDASMKEGDTVTLRVATRWTRTVDPLARHHSAREHGRVPGLSFHAFGERNLRLQVTVSRAARTGITATTGSGAAWSLRTTRHRPTETRAVQVRPRTRGDCSRMDG